METKVKPVLPGKVKYFSMFDKVENEQSFTSKLKFRNFKLNWTIENFEFVCKSLKLIESPRFPSDNVTDVQWFVQLEPTELKDGNSEKFRISLKNTDGNERHVNVKITFRNTFKKVEIFISSFLRSDNNLYWLITGSDFYHSFEECVPKNVLVTCELSVFDSGTSVVEKPLVDFPKCSDLAENIESLYHDKDFKDVTFTIGRKKFTAHKIILSSRSPVFAKMFAKNKKKEELKSIVKITDLKATVFENLLRFIYTDRVENLSKTATQLYAAAEKYQLKKLKTMCINNLNANLSPETVLKTLNFADMKNIPKLKAKCLERLNTDMQSVQDSKEFDEFLQKYPHLIEEFKNVPEIVDPEQVHDEDAQCHQQLGLRFRL